MITIGADPEVFLFDKKKNHFITAKPFIPGTKEEPQVIKEGFSVHLDCVAAEYNIPPTTSSRDFLAANRFMLDTINSLIPGDVEIRVQGTAEFPSEELENIPASESGCEPDYNVWTRDVNPTPNFGTMNLRCSAGHIHIGYPNVTEERSELLVKALDYHFSCAMISNENPLDFRRRNWYGKAGSFRFKEYGVEYRTPSNFWLRSAELVERTYNMIYKITSDLDKHSLEFLNRKEAEIKHIINKQELVLL